jgi:hypothetical protein
MTATVPVRTASPTPTIEEQPPRQAVDTALAGQTTIECVRVPGSNACTFVFSFAPQGFPPTAVFRVAVRGDGDERWTILPEPVPVGGQDETQFENDVGVTAPLDPQQGGATATIQVAVLVFFEPPPPLPETVRQLGDTNADFAYVTPAVVVESSSL